MFWLHVSSLFVLYRYTYSNVWKLNVQDYWFHTTSLACPLWLSQDRITHLRELSENSENRDFDLYAQHQEQFLTHSCRLQQISVEWVMDGWWSQLPRDWGTLIWLPGLESQECLRELEARWLMRWKVKSQRTRDWSEYWEGARHRQSFIFSRRESAGPKGQSLEYFWERHPPSKTEMSFNLEVPELA